MEKRILNYTVVFEPSEEGGFVVYVPALPGCITEGESFEDAKIKAKDAIKGYLEVVEDSGEDIPTESDEAVISKVKVNI